GFDDPTKDTYRNYKLQYSSILYADDALRSFFDAYSKRPDYNNTIFLITGDHRMPEIPMSTKIDRYHVPLLIYSPLLKRTATFSSVSTHFDIAPSLMSYLKYNYAFAAPAYGNWIGNGLDTARNFRNIHAYPLIQTKTETIDFIMGEYHLNGNILYKLTEGLTEEPIKDEGKLGQLRGAFNNFKQRNGKVTSNKSIVPDSLYRRYTPAKK
ncbi:MAG: LTA synthase family protein, partial [Sphingobacteriales bacterium]